MDLGRVRMCVGLVIDLGEVRSRHGDCFSVILGIVKETSLGEDGFASGSDLGSTSG